MSIIKILAFPRLNFWFRVCYWRDCEGKQIDFYKKICYYIKKKVKIGANERKKLCIEMFLVEKIEKIYYYIYDGKVCCKSRRAINYNIKFQAMAVTI